MNVHRTPEKRLHRGKNLLPPDHDDNTPALVTAPAAARIQRYKILGGLINEYVPAA